MKKKIVIAVVFIFIIVILFLGKVCKISFIKDIQDIFYNKDKMSDNSEKKCTVIDVTDLEDEGSVEHDHTFKTMYNENEHWEECTVCGEINNRNTHSYKTTWASGSESCSNDNYYTNTCSCGYSYIGHRPCVWNGKERVGSGYFHYKICSICNTVCWSGYYLYSYGNGKVYHESARNQCYTSNGTLINCNTGGTCVACGKVRSKGEHVLMTNNNRIYCELCGNDYGTYSKEVEQIANAPASYKIITQYNLFNATYSKINTNENLFTGIFQSISRRVFDKISNTQFKVETILNFRNDYKVCNNGSYFYIYLIVNGKEVVCREHIDINDNVKPDTEKPKLLGISMGNSGEELTHWSRTKPIIISGTENYCNTVNVNIVDENGETIFEGEGNVVGNNFSISCVPYIEVDTNGKTFTAILKDACDNEIRKEFTISKVDAISPKATSSDDITGEWSKSRKFTFKAADYGIGEVSIAFNDIEDLSLANFDGTEYSRDYEFYGDVYNQKKLSVLYRDGLGNTSIQKITIDKLDNTVPTIESASIHNNVVTINANDRHERLGEGSGIVKYRYIASSEKLSNPDFSNGIEVNASDKMVIDDVYKVKYIYMVAEDLVGNISEVYELKVPELILTSSVDLSLANGKGGVVLDWSSYDVSDKYFVVYRKEENSESWETIVSLDDKLTGSTYTDILGNDKAKPDTPNINITGAVLNNNIKVDVISADNGTKYIYYIEAYDDTNILINVSNEIN